MRLPRLVQVVGVNSVPLVGFFGADWSGATALAFYWCENALVTLFVSLRIWRHRLATGHRDHWDSLGADRRGGRSRTTFLGSFALFSGIFTVAHGLFLAGILFVALPRTFPDERGLSMLDLRDGVLVAAIVLISGLVLDLRGIEHRPFAWIRQMARRVITRVVIVHLTLIFGMAAVEWLGGPRGLFLVFAGFKVAADIGAFVMVETAG